MKSAIKVCLLLVVSLALAPRGFAQSVDAGEREDGESEVVKVPARAPSDAGLYKGVNEVPEEVRRSAPFARALHEMQLRAGENGEFSVEERIKAFEASQQDLLTASAAMKSGGKNASPFGDAWTNIGLKGASSTGVYSGGCTAALAVNPSNPSIMYAGATSGGVWKSVDAGSTWVQLTDLVIPNQTVASIAIDPNNPNTIYVGTGNGYASVDELTGTGIYKSTDGGGTWRRLSSSTVTGTVVKVLVHPTKSNIVFASTYSSSRGLYRSTDSGSTWTRVFPTSGTAGAVIWDIAPGVTINGTVIFYFVEGNNPGGSSNEAGVYKSANDGATWSKITSSPLPAGSRIGRSALVTGVENRNRVFVLMSNTSGDTLGLFRSTDNGSSWSSIAIPGTLFKPNVNNPGQGWYDVMLGVTPYSNDGHDTLYIGGVEAYVNYGGSNQWTMFSGYADLPASAPHVDHHCIAFNPLNPLRVYVGGDGGVYWSQNAGRDWAYRSNQMISNRFYHIGLDKNDSKSVFGGAQDQGTWKVTVGGSTSLRFQGDGFQPIVSTQSSSIYFAELPNGQLFRTSNSGSNWSPLGDNYFDDNTNWDTPFKMAAANLGSTSAANILYAGRQSLWRSVNAGDSWTSISPNFSNGPITSIGISQVDSRNVYVGVRGAIYLTTDAGGSWNAKNTGVPSSTITSIVTTGRDTNFALASAASAGAARVIMTTNKGTSWTNVSGTSGAALPNVAVNCVALDSINPKTTWYAATDNGIYYTLDAGSHWSIAGSGLGLAPCRDVQVHQNKTTIRVATFGRGIWEANATILPVELSSLTYQKTPSGTRLFWHTDSERGNNGFYVQRSIDGAAFEDLGFVPGAGTSNNRNDYAYLDTMHRAGTYLYQLKQVDLDGSEHYSNHVELHYGNDQMIVYQNYPNPLLLGVPHYDNAPSLFGDELSGVTPALSTRFKYELPDNDVVSIRLYSSTGVLIKTIVDHEAQTAGEHDAFWFGDDSDGKIVSSGAYFYVVESEHYGSFVHKLMLVHN